MSSFLENKMSLHRLNALLQGPGSNDCSLSERVINVATSLPFLAVGVCTQRWFLIYAPGQWQLQVQMDNKVLYLWASRCQTAALRETDSRYEVMMARRRQTSEGRLFGAWLMAVGTTAAAYHASDGRLRCALRKLDYW